MEKLNNSLEVSMVRKGGGFTLLELMIVVALMGIVVAIAMPNFESSRNRAAIKEFTLELESSLILAKKKAMDLGENVTLCPIGNVVTASTGTSTNCLANWDDFVAGGDDGSLGWMVFADDLRANTLSNLNQLISVVPYNARHGRAIIDTTSTAGIVSFSRRGISPGSAGTFNIDSSKAGYADKFVRNLVVSAQGRIRNVLAN